MFVYGRLIPTQDNIPIKELRNYLTVYLLREKNKKMQWDDFIKIVKSETKIFLGNNDYPDSRGYKRYCTNAENIIINVGRGEFPGNYKEKLETSMDFTQSALKNACKKKKLK